MKYKKGKDNVVANVLSRIDINNINDINNNDESDDDELELLTRLQRCQNKKQQKELGLDLASLFPNIDNQEIPPDADEILKDPLLICRT